MTSVTPELQIERRPWRSSTTPLWRRLRESSVGWEAILLYTIVALVLGRHTIAHAGSVFPGINIPDSWELTWPYEWFPYAIGHGLNPWYTHAIWSPTGLNMAAATSFPLLALLFTPVTLIWGPVVSASIANLAAPVVTSWATYLLCRYVSKDRTAALLGGATVGFGSYVVLQMWAGHTLMTAFFLPQFAVLAVLRYLDGAITNRRFTIELTLCLVAQVFISTEVFATMTLFGGVLLVTGYLFGTSEIRDGIKRLIVPMAIAYGITVVVSAQYLYWLLKGAPAYAAGIGAEFPTDLMSYVVPSNLTWILGPQFASVFARFSWASAESDAYLGVPLILITLYWLATRRKTRLGRFMGVSVALSVLWVLGSTLYIDGKPTIWMPYRLLSGLPLIKMILESRCAVFTELLAAVILTLWLSERRRGTRVKAAMSWAAALVALAFVLPNLWNINPMFQNNRGIPQFFATNMYRHYIKRGGTILPIHWSWNSPALMWQANDHLYYNIAGGYFTLSLPPGWADTRVLYDLWNNVPQQSDGPGLRALMKEKRVDDVVVEPAELPLWKPALRAAGLGRPLYVGGIYLYKAPWRVG